MRRLVFLSTHHQQINPFENPYQAFVSYKNHLRLNLPPPTRNCRLFVVSLRLRLTGTCRLHSTTRWHTLRTSRTTAALPAWLTEERPALYAPDTSRRSGGAGSGGDPVHAWCCGSVVRSRVSPGVSHQQDRDVAHCEVRPSGTRCVTRRCPISMWR